MANTFTYWILPEPSVQEKLQLIVNDLAQKYGTPTFEPHMTLLGGFTENKELALEKAEEVASQLHDLELSFGVVEFSTTYYQNVFVRINANAKLMDAYIYGRDLFGLNRDTVFMPHISLLYGNLKMSEREAVAQSTRIPPVSITSQTFKARSLVVTPFAPSPADWEHLKEVEL